MLSILAALTLAPGSATVPLRVVAVFNVTGSMASVDRPGYLGLRLAAEELNRQGQPVQVQLLDLKSQSANVEGRVAKFLKLHPSDAVAGLYDSDYALPAGRAAQKARVPFVTSGATLPGLTEKIGDHAFAACYGDDDQARAMAVYARTTLQAERATVIGDPGHIYTSTIAKDFANSFMSLGGRVGGVLLSPTFVRDKRTLKPAPEAIYVASLPDDAGPAVKALRRQGFRGAILSGDGFDTPTLAKVAGRDSNSVFFTTHVAYDSPSPDVRRFVTAYRQRYSTTPDSAAAALGYDTLKLIAAARKSNPTGPLRNALSLMRSFRGVTGVIGYRPGHREPVKPITVVEIENGRPEYRETVLPR